MTVASADRTAMRTSCSASAMDRGREPGGGSTASLALSGPALDTVLTTMSGLKLENGEPMGVDGDTLIVGPALKYRALSLVGADVSRWNEVAEAFPRFSPERRGQFLEMLTARMAGTTGEERVDLRRTLSRIAERHGRFRAADWALVTSRGVMIFAWRG